MPAHDQEVIAYKEGDSATCVYGEGEGEGDSLISTQEQYTRGETCVIMLCEGERKGEGGYYTRPKR